MKRIQLLLISLLFSGIGAVAQESLVFPIPEDLPQGYPRIYVTQAEKGKLEETIRNEAWAKEVLTGLHEHIDEHVNRHVDDPEWMVSRLQMYWKTKATKVYVNGIDYSHADGEAPVPTVRFSGSRNTTTPYGSPRLEDILPYMDDPRGLYLPNRSKEGNPFEWAEPSKTGTIIANINNNILGLAEDAAFLYWLENDERFAKFSFDVFDTYMTGMSYRGEPVDLLNGHIQTLVGFTHFQVIHERALETVAVLYDFLHPYIQENYPGKIDMYDTTIKRWTDQVIKNGVPQNNWNLHQANIIQKAAMVLEDNEHYADKKGRQYYINYILNVTSARQWSLSKFMDFGYDKENGIWNECPGYAQGVTGALMRFIVNFDNSFDLNLIPYTPVMEKAVKVFPQYTFPNGQSVAFGDSNYRPIGTGSMEAMIRLAQKSGDKKLEEEFTALLRLFDPDYGEVNTRRRPRADIGSFFASSPLVLNPKFKAGKLEDYITQTFYATNVSWHVQRIGQGTDGLMASLNGSLGNHMHANGINMELYGKGFVLGPDPGKGPGGYLDAPYLEYYSQFPAHNTVMVDGASSYTEMLSYHAFDLISEYPVSEQKDGYFGNITYSKVYFLEPETRSDQTRLVSIVNTSDSTGYYIDIFRSRKQRKGDKFHDYYYHNLGQSMQVMDARGKPLALKPSEEMGFAGGHLYALDYMWDKKSVSTGNDYQVEWKMDMPDQPDVLMNLWMKGCEGREVFSIKSPPCYSFRGNQGIPYDVDKEPFLTLAARQHGEAWEHPFISVYEPYTSDEGRSISSIKGFEDENGSKEFAGIHIIHNSGREDYVLASANATVVSSKGRSTDADYALIADEPNKAMTLFMGNGTMLSANGYSIEAAKRGNVVFEIQNGTLSLHNDVAVTISYSGLSESFKPGSFRLIEINTDK